jgi:hypothetical protein
MHRPSPATGLDQAPVRGRRDADEPRSGYKQIEASRWGDERDTQSMPLEATGPRPPRRTRSRLGPGSRSRPHDRSESRHPVGGPGDARGRFVRRPGRARQGRPHPAHAAPGRAAHGTLPAGAVAADGVRVPSCGPAGARRTPCEDCGGGAAPGRAAGVAGRGRRPDVRHRPHRSRRGRRVGHEAGLKPVHAPAILSIC